MVENKKQINSSNKGRGIQILLLSLSVLAFITSQYSSLISTYFISSFKLFSSSTTSDRHYIFLLCNGLMLLVIKTSGLFSTPSPPPGAEFYRDSHVIRIHVQPSHHQSDHLSESSIHVKNSVISHQPVVEFNKKNNVELQIDHLPETDKVTYTKFITQPNTGMTVKSTTLYEEKEQVNHLNYVHQGQGQEEEEEYEELESTNIEEEEEEEEGIMLWSTEELNKKCDDFIRKMKYGIRFEAPLVMV